MSLKPCDFILACRRPSLLHNLGDCQSRAWRPRRRRVVGPGWGATAGTRPVVRV